MDSTRVARLIVAVRQEKRWRQVDLARLARVSQTMDTSFPGRAAQVRRWIRSPDGPIAAIWFVDLRRSSGSLPARRVRPSTSG